MKNDLRHQEQFDASAAPPLPAEDLFLPSIEAVVRHIARVVAERDYKHFLTTGEIPYSGDTSKEGGSDD